MRDDLFDRRDQGPRVVAIGGGTGLSTMLRGLKNHTKNLTAIVTVADDGGGSGMLRQDLGMPPPGDIRHCMEALANAEPLMQQLLTYRFPAGSGNLTGQSFGNLILAALNGISGSFDEAVAKMSQVLAITGRVLPVTTANVTLEATFENGTRVLGSPRSATSRRPRTAAFGAYACCPSAPPPCLRLSAPLSRRSSSSWGRAASTPASSPICWWRASPRRCAPPGRSRSMSAIS